MFKLYQEKNWCKVVYKWKRLINHWKNKEPLKEWHLDWRYSVDTPNKPRLFRVSTTLRFCHTGDRLTRLILRLFALSNKFRMTLYSIVNYFSSHLIAIIYHFIVFLDLCQLRQAWKNGACPVDKRHFFKIFLLVTARGCNILIKLVLTRFQSSFNHFQLRLILHHLLI